MSRIALCVVGMHRSGTSALTRVISMLGYALPDDLMVPQSDNPKGFWEPRGIVRLNNEILRQIDAAWDRPGPILTIGPSAGPGNGDVMAMIIQRYLDRAVSAIRGSFGTADRIVVKDPRIGLMWPLWQSAFEQAGFGVQHVLTYRNPLDVAASLEARSGMDQATALRLWAWYNSVALQHERTGNLVAVVSYDHLLDATVQTIDRLARSLDPQGTANEQQVSEAAATIAQEDRHHRHTRQDLARYRTVPPLVRQMFRLLEDWDIVAPEKRAALIANQTSRLEEAMLIGGHAISVSTDMLATTS